MTHSGFKRALSDMDLLFITMEFGTFTREQGHKVYREDHWLHENGDLSSVKGRAIKAAIQKHLFPNTPDWNEMVLWRGLQVVRQAFAGVASE